MGLNFHFIKNYQFKNPLVYQIFLEGCIIARQNEATFIFTEWFIGIF
jgi:hypothetical protein